MSEDAECEYEACQCCGKRRNPNGGLMCECSFEICVGSWLDGTLCKKCTRCCLCPKRYSRPYPRWYDKVGIRPPGAVNPIFPESKEPKNYFTRQDIEFLKRMKIKY